MKLHDYEIEDEILTLLRQDEKLTSMVGNNIYPTYIDKDTQGNAVYYDSELDDPLTCKMGTVTRVMHMYFGAVCDRMADSNRIIGQIQDVLEGEYRNPYMKIRAVGTLKDGVDLKYEKAIEFIVEW